MQDSEIIALYFGRNENAIEETKAKYGCALNGLAFKILKNNEDSEECVNDTYLKAWETIPPQKPAHFFAYLAKICRFICFGRLDYNKAQKRNAEVVTLSEELLACIPSGLSEVSIDEELLKELLERFLKSLPKEKRLIFMLRYWFAESVEEIAERFSISQSKVKTTLFRLRGQLKTHLNNEGVNI